MPTTRAASAPSRRAIRKEEIKRQVPVANQLQLTKPSLVPPNHPVKAFCRCHSLSWRLQYPLLFVSEFRRNPPFITGQPPTPRKIICPIGMPAIAANPPFLSFSPPAQSPAPR